jgi:hypothetical protein
MLAANILEPTTQVCPEGESDWRPILQLVQMPSAVRISAIPTKTATGRGFINFSTSWTKVVIVLVAVSIAALFLTYVHHHPDSFLTLRQSFTFQKSSAPPNFLEREAQALQNEANNIPTDPNRPVSGELGETFGTALAILIVPTILCLFFPQRIRLAAWIVGVLIMSVLIVGGSLGNS